METYSYVGNNPLRYNDPTGMAPEEPNHIASTFVNGNGKVIEHRDDNDDNVYLVGNGWVLGDSKKDLQIIGKEKEGIIYTPGFSYQFDENQQLGYRDWNNNFPKASGAITPIGGAFDIAGVWEALSMTTNGNSDIIALLVIITGKAPKSTATIGIKNSHHLIPKAIFKQLKKDLENLMKLNGKNNLMDLMTPFHGNHPQYSKYVKNYLISLINSRSMNKQSIEAVQTNLRSIISKAQKEYDKTGKNLNEYFRQFNK